jgi:lysophospholipase L1-like esterase
VPARLTPKVFWLLVGTNDLGEDHCSVESIVAGNLRIVQELQRRRQNVKIVINLLLPRTTDEDGRLGPIWQTIQSINQLLYFYAETMKNVYISNATDLFLRNELTMDVELMPDLLHPSAAGSRLWGGDILKMVSRLIDEWDVPGPHS